MIDARRNRVYTGIYKWEGGEKLINTMEPTAMEIDHLLEMLREYENIIVNGNGTHLYRDKIVNTLGVKLRLSPIGLNECKASSIGELAIIKYNEGIGGDDYYTLAPEYLNESQAQRELRKKEG